MARTKFFDIAGKKFGSLTAIRKVGSYTKGQQIWLFKCDCGNEIRVLPGRVVNGYQKKCCKCRNLKDLTGKKFGRLTVIKKDRFENGKSYWLCKCDCGGERVYLHSNLTGGKSTTCGCGRMLDRAQGESGLNELYHGYQDNAKKKKRDFDINLEDFKRLTSENCHYCGKEPSQVSGRNSEYSQYKYNGLDRVDSSKGYSVDNVVPCCRWCNIMKHDFSNEEFLEQIKRIYEHRIK
jgi:hypothetical protein